jgi:hypothetical protein
VRDLVIHGDDLVAATHGRAFWILDDIAPLRQIDARVASAEVWLYQPATAIRMNPESFTGTPFPPEEPQAKNPPEGAILDYFLKSAPQGEVVLEILDNQNQPIRRYSSTDRAEAPGRPGAIADIWIVPPPRLTAKAGMNRFAWDLRYGAAEGPQVLPGTYTARLTVAGRSYTQPLKVTLDPRSVATPEDLSKQLELSLSASRAIRQAAETMSQVSALRSQLAQRRQAAEGASNAALVSKIADLDAEAAKISLSATSRELGSALSVAESADRTPPATAYQAYDQASRALAAQVASWKTLLETGLGDLNRELAQNRLPVIDPGIR